MTFLKRAALAVAASVILILVAVYFPAPISTAASIALACFALLLLLPLILAVIGMISAADEGGFFGDILEVWFLWGVLDWWWDAIKWMFTRTWPNIGKKREREKGPPFNREA